jgi:hypothetical protein
MRLQHIGPQYLSGAFANADSESEFAMAGMEKFG